MKVLVSGYEVVERCRGKGRECCREEVDRQEKKEGENLSRRTTVRETGVIFFLFFSKRDGDKWRQRCRALIGGVWCV